MTNPLREMDDEARGLIADLLTRTRHGALAVTDPEDNLPNISRIALARAPDGAPLSLISDLSQHATALKANPNAAILLGEPGSKGDPLTHPRLSLRVTARFIRHGSDDHAPLARHYLSQYPKAKLYIGFGDFALVHFTVRDGLLNGGFGKAYPVTSEDILTA
ncbi:HugZ family protein [Primorskyibacter sp. S187A]|uniref:HugZ family pyridoxamine 5'-phosphate oxidase n=1 Tax=Primorskyibacter sp. S187A TaxID=3415130 RepID=UPI003C7CC49C